MHSTWSQNVKFYLIFDNRLQQENTLLTQKVKQLEATVAENANGVNNKPYELLVKEERPEGTRCRMPISLCCSVNTSYASFAVVFGSTTVYNICKPSHCKSKLESRYVLRRLYELYAKHKQNDIEDPVETCSVKSCKAVTSGFISVVAAKGKFKRMFCTIDCLCSYMDQISIKKWRELTTVNSEKSKNKQGKKKSKQNKQQKKKRSRNDDNEEIPNSVVDDDENTDVELGDEEGDEDGDDEENL